MGQKRGLSVLLKRAAMELAVVFLGVFAALWVDASQESAEKQAKSLAIASAMSTEIGHLTNWYSEWRPSIDSAYSAWRERVENGEQPAPFYFRVPGAERTPQVGWDAGVASGLLETFDPVLVFDLGNMYHEWHEIGERVARYHELTERLVLPAVADPALAWTIPAVPGRSTTAITVGDPVVKPLGLRTVEVPAGLRPEFAAHLALMEEVLREMNDKFDWASRVGEDLNAAIDAVR